MKPREGQIILKETQRKPEKLKGGPEKAKMWKVVESSEKFQRWRGPQKKTREKERRFRDAKRQRGGPEKARENERRPRKCQNSERRPREGQKLERRPK